MCAEDILTETELDVAKGRALFDLVLCGVRLDQIPREHRLANRNGYIAALRRSRAGWSTGDYSETEAALRILEDDIQHMEPCAYRKWLEEAYAAYEKSFVELGE